MIEAELKARLEALQTELARTALTSPSDRDAFEYGRVCGMYAGLERARSVLQNLIDDKDRRDNEL